MPKPQTRTPRRPDAATPRGGGARRPGPLLLVSALAACLVPSTAALAAGTSNTGAAAAPAPPAVAAQAAEVMDAKSGQVLYALNPQMRTQPASLAKMMTFDLALAAIAAGKVTPGTMIPVGVDAWQVSLDQSVSRMYLLPNVPVSLQNLLIGLMVPSGNDAALALADYFGGSEQGFVQQMNAEAQAIGLANTHYENSSGLGAADQYTTAADVALLARHLWLTYPNFRQYTDLASFTWNKVKQSNYNELIGTDPRVFGLKSGYLSSSGYHLVATATQGSTDLIAVVLGTASLQASADEDEKLLNWGFANFQDVRVDWAAATPRTARVWKGRSGTVPLTVAANPWVTVGGGGQSAPPVHVSAELRSPLAAPLAKGQPVGTARVVVGGKTVETVPILTAAAVARGGFIHVAWDAFRLHLASLLARLHL